MPVLAHKETNPTGPIEPAAPLNSPGGPNPTDLTLIQSDEKGSILPVIAITVVGCCAVGGTAFAVRKKN